MKSLRWMCLILVLILCSCAGSPETDSRHEAIADQDTHERTVSVEKSMQDAMDRIKTDLENTGSGYRWIERDYFYHEGERFPALWLFAVNDLGEYVDVLFMELSQDEMIQIMEEGISGGVFAARKNEKYSYLHAWHYPIEQAGFDAVCYPSEDSSYMVLYSGSDLMEFDLNLYHFMENDPGAVIWTGDAWEYATQRPEKTNVPIDYEANPGEFGEYRTYKTAESMESEFSAMQKRLTDTGLGYEWEIQDTIRVNGKEYPVTWMYAVNEREEWVDVVFSEDAELCYLLQTHPEIFEKLREPQRAERNARYPARMTHELGPQYADRHEFLVQDCFYHDYCYYMNGTPLAMIDCGAIVDEKDWNEELQDYVIYLSREGMLGVNVPFSNIPYPQS